LVLPCVGCKGEKFSICVDLELMATFSANEFVA